MRTIAIGDIHGGLKGLKQVLERAKVTSQDELIFMGDYVDGWSESAQLIDFLIELSYGNNCHFIFGNHDAWCYDWLTRGTENHIWLKHGGKETVMSYEGYSSDQKDEHIALFMKMKNYYVDSKNRLFIHAGYTSMHGPAKEHYASNYGWDRTLWEMAVAVHGRIDDTDEAYPDRLKLFSEIYIGHTPTTKWGIDYPWNRANVWNLDTGAAFKGKLSALDIDTKEFWQSDPVMELYPKEVGRNKLIK
ncbi:MAG: serine/threonine protein phosphatase [Crocinitomix sp.]|nr:serine/threonine protein phosphatase [Crocinitomix sp.]